MRGSRGRLMPRLLAVVTALLLHTLAARAHEPQPGPRPGDVYEIRSEAVSSNTSSQGSSGSAHDRDTLIERVIAVRDTGVELEFDLAREATTEDRAAYWQFPVRVLRPPQGPLQLLNA